MARIRTIKPDFFRHEELVKAEKESGLPLRLAFAGLWTVSDREGLFKWKPSEIKLDIFPYEEVDMPKILEALRYYGFIIQYETDGKVYGFIPTFKDHQVINNREAPSKLPKPRVTEQSVTRHGLAQGEGKGREGNTYTRVTESLCKVFAKNYKEPEKRMTAEHGFYRDIDTQADLILQVHKPEVAIKQINAYIQYCKTKDRKPIGSAYKLSETLLSADWVKLLSPDVRAPVDDFKAAEADKKIWNDQAWTSHYADQIKNNVEFKKHFGL